MNMPAPLSPALDFVTQAGRGDLFRLLATSLPSGTSLVGFRGSEALSNLYRFELGLSLEAGREIDMAAVLGTRVAIESQAAAPSRHHGVVAGIELVDATSERSLYLLTMVPELWHLMHSTHSRVYTDVTLPEILQAVLAFSGLPSDSYELHIREHSVRFEHVAQYRESDFAFISRLMERDGLYYFFEHGESREKLIITDHLGSHPLTASVRYEAWSQEGSQNQTGGIERFRCRVSALPSSVRLDDYDPLHPGVPIRGAAEVSQGRGDVVLYGENLRTAAEGARLARVRAEELLARRAVYEGSGMALGLVSGARFELEGHPHANLNRAYLVVGLEHVGTMDHGTPFDQLLGLSDDSYRVQIRAIADDVQFRAARVTPWPRIDGVVDGVVDGGADSVYAQVDAHGRYKVRIFFDESDLVDGSASTWVRMLQPHGGDTEGMHFPLRKGTEVHMVFLGGDPDRPVIVGTAPNAHKPSKVTASNYAENVLRTGGNNQLVMTDTGGSESVYMSTPHCNTSLHMGAGGMNLVLSTDGNYCLYVGGTGQETIAGTFDQTISGAVSLSFESNLVHSVTGDVSQSYDATQSFSVTGNASHAYASQYRLGISGDFHLWSGGPASWEFSSGREQIVDVSESLIVNGPTTEQHNGTLDTTVTGAHSLSVTGAQLIEGMATQTICANSQKIEADAMQLLKASTHKVEASVALIDAQEIGQNAAGDHSITAGGAAMVSASSVSVDAGSYQVAGGSRIGMSASDTLIQGSGTAILNGGAVGIVGGVVAISAGIIRLN